MHWIWGVNIVFFKRVHGWWKWIKYHIEGSRGAWLLKLSKLSRIIPLKILSYHKIEIKVVPRQVRPLGWLVFYFKLIERSDFMLDKKYNHQEVEKGKY